MSRLISILCKVASLSLVSTSAMAAKYEITPYIGIMSTSDLSVPDETTSISIENATSYGISIAWQESPNGQGQILLNRASYDFKYGDEANSSSFDVTYAHFNGVALFRQREYITTVSIGLGVASFNADGGSEISPSFSAAIGTRYELSNEFSIVTEIRSYASLMQDGDTLFCQNDVCAAEFDDTVWIDTAISLGVSYKF